MPDEAPVTSAVAAGSGAGKPMSGPYPRLQVAQRPFHDRVGDRTPQRTGHEAARIDAQVELDPRARAPVDRDEAPLARKVAEVAAGILAAEPLRRVVDLAQPVAHRLHARVDLELDEAAATLLVALEHAHRLDRLLPLGQALEVGQQVEAPLRGRGDLGRAAIAVARHLSPPSACARAGARPGPGAPRRRARSASRG